MTELEWVVSQINDKMRQMEEDTIAGSAKDYDDYRFACGIYRGLALAKGFIVEVVERQEEDDD